MSVPTPDTLRRLAAALRDQGGLLAAALDGRDPAGDGPGATAATAESAASATAEGSGPPSAGADGAPAGPGLGTLAAAGPRSAGREAEVAFVVEAIREGYLLHYGAGRLLRDDDRDLALLAGDHLYALGLERLAALGDLPAVAELADVISLSAQAHAEARPELAEAAWEAGAAAVGWGADGDLHAAKAAARAGAPEAVEGLRAAARRLAGSAGAPG